LIALGSSRFAGMMLPGNGSRTYCPFPISAVQIGGLSEG
jgi:hypothetical protein